MNERKMTCIMCPKGCYLIAREMNNKISVSGNACKKGEEYAISEIKNPQRILTTTIKIKTDSTFDRLAIMSKTFVDKKDLIKLCLKLKDVEINKLVKQGDTVCIIDGIEFVASSTLE